MHTYIFFYESNYQKSGFYFEGTEWKPKEPDASVQEDQFNSIKKHNEVKKTNVFFFLPVFLFFGSNMMKQLDSESVKSLTLIHSHSELHNTAQHETQP